jgi:hypothetical protein
MVPRSPQKFCSSGYFDDGTHVAPGLNGEPNHADRHTQELSVMVLHPNSIVLNAFLPKLQFDNQVDSFSIPYGSHTIEVLHIEDPKSSHLHKMSEGIGGLTEDHSWGTVIAFHDIISYQTMPAHDQLKSALALSDPALSDQQDPYFKNIYQHPVHAGTGSKMLVQHRVDCRDGDG